MMLFLKKKKYLLFSLIVIYLVINIIKSIFNIYTFTIFLILSIYILKTNKKSVKRILHKSLFKSNFIKIENKYYAAKKSLIGISEVKSLIKNRVNIEIINIEKNKIERQLKHGNYSVILFGACSSGKTSLARSILKSMVGETSPILGTTKDIKSYKINVPFLKRKINIIDTPGLFEPSSVGERREKSNREINNDILGSPNS